MNVTEQKAIEDRKWIKELTKAFGKLFWDFLAVLEPSNNPNAFPTPLSFSGVSVLPERSMIPRGKNKVWTVEL